MERNKSGVCLQMSRRSFCAVTAGLVGAASARAAFGAIGPSGPVLDTPKIVGPIPTADGNRPYASTLQPGSYTAELMHQFDYVEEEYFLSGHANIYGPGIKLATAVGAPGPNALEVQNIRPLASIFEAAMPYTTRLLMIRPRDNSRFSGRVHAYPFHNKVAKISAEFGLMRNGDAILSVECCSGTRDGKQEEPSGGIAQLHLANLGRYRDLYLSYADPLAWPDLKPGALAHAMATMDYSRTDVSPEVVVYTQEAYRSYAQGPDILTQVAHALRNNNPSFPFENSVKYLFSYGASGGSTMLQAYIDYHHNLAMTPDGKPPFDGYLALVAILPENRPNKAVLAMLESEQEAKTGFATHRVIPSDSDNPRFRFYEIPSTGHLVSAPILPSGQGPAGTDLPASAIQAAVPSGGPPPGVVPYDKINMPLVWGVWENMYDWIEKGIPMPHAKPITIDPQQPDGIARDQYGNAKGGIRTPWVEVPDATYISRLSKNDPLRAGMRRFDDAKMTKLYGSRKRYAQLVNQHIDQLIRDRWIRSEDAQLMRLKS